MMKLGSYRFEAETATYQDLDAKTGERWADIQLVQAPTALQYIGPGLQTLTLKGVVFPHYAGGASQVENMKRQRGRPQMLVQGDGFVFGRWVITDISEARSVFFRDGAARKQTFSISLKRYLR